MAVLNVNPTRMELTKIKKRLTSAVKGHKLLKDKRDELMRQFLDIMRKAKHLRRQTEAKLIEINRGFALASSLMQREALISALMMPRQSTALEITSRSVMGIDVPVFDGKQGLCGKGAELAYGYAFTCGELDASISELSAILADLLSLAELEKRAQMLSSEIEKTRRRVNALEYIMIPNYQDTIRYITMKLDENERSNLTRLMKVKDMMIEKQIENRRRQTAKLAAEGGTL